MVTNLSGVTNCNSVFLTVKARLYSQKQSKHINVDTSKCISECNKHMGGVDMLDKQMSYTEFESREKNGGSCRTRNLLTLLL